MFSNDKKHKKDIYEFNKAKSNFQQLIYQRQTKIALPRRNSKEGDEYIDFTYEKTGSF